MTDTVEQNENETETSTEGTVSSVLSDGIDGLKGVFMVNDTTVIDSFGKRAGIVAGVSALAITLYSKFAVKPALADSQLSKAQQNEVINNIPLGRLTIGQA